MSQQVNRNVAAALRADIEDLRPGRANVVFSVGDEDDARAIRKAFSGAPFIDLTILHQDGTGKRRAVADALSVLHGKGVAPGTTVLLMDGDTLIPKGTFKKTIPLLRALPDVGALTVHNEPLVDGPGWVCDWYRLRMMQRHIQMSSLSLSERVLVLTGRWSLYRAELALHPDFAAQIARDTLYHNRDGNIPLLTGEDKSTWRWIIERGYKAIYVPDTVVHPLEKLPDPRFFRSTIALMRRWFGNMNRGGSQAIPLGPRRLGWFPWLVLLDQRISMWTTLSGPVSCLAAVLLTAMPGLIAVYFLWTLLSRTAHSLAIGFLAKAWTPLFPFLMYYTQIVGALVKVYVSFHPAKQKWTRQNTATMASSSWRSTTMMVLVSALFLTAITATSGMLIEVANN
ncbi:MAG: glycosyltransferase [Rhizobium pusense]|nr:glycosyltransferase [Agrobacterium pusense]